MTKQFTRREALQTSAMLGAGLYLGAVGESRAKKSPNEKLNLAVIGIGGRGGANLGGVKSQNIVALCDVDDKRAGKAYDKHPKAEKFYDFRRLYDTMEKRIDGVVISTPDHTHFHPAIRAMQMGKHVYCEKPMAHNVWEVREMTKLAREKGIATQLGVQRHTLNHVHRAVELIQNGVIGDVLACHAWVGGSRGMPKVPTEKPKVPNHLKWDLWLGPTTQDRAYHSSIAPYGWRFWWDYGTGETGNWGCHILDIPFWGLGLKYPTKVKATGPEVDPERTPKAMNVEFEFPNKAGQPIHLHWYHTGKAPAILSEKKVSGKGANNLFIGTKGMLLCGFGMHKLYMDGKEVSAPKVEKRLPNSPGFYKEWIQACKGDQPATCHFDYSGPLTETVLLGNVAYRAGGEFAWDAENLQAKGNDKAQRLIREEYRKGWTV